MLYDLNIVLAHSAKGTTWKKHKYVRKDGNRYIYKNSSSGSVEKKTFYDRDKLITDWGRLHDKEIDMNISMKLANEADTGSSRRFFLNEYQKEIEEGMKIADTIIRDWESTSTLSKVLGTVNGVGRTYESAKEFKKKFEKKQNTKRY